jgi:xanthine dehydrogenase YagR molybdenum-binding subunit
MNLEFPQPRYRISGKAKVQGLAKFSAEFRPEKMAYACLVQSTIAKGRIETIDSMAAEHSAGVLVVLTPANAPRLPNAGNTGLEDAHTLTLLQDSLVHYHGQPIAVVVAGSLEEAAHAGSLLSVRYATQPADLSFQQGVGRTEVIKEGLQVSDSTRGDIEGALRRADVRVEATYSTPIENHNPIEPHATLAQWDGDKLLVHEPTQWLMNNCKVYARTFGIPDQNVRVISEFVGGSFGCKGSVWSHAILAAMAARVVDRPVRLALERKQMFTVVGARPRTQQKIVVGAARDGKLLAVRHDVVAHTAHLEEFLESSAQVTRRLYASEAAATSHRLVRLNVTVPHVMRAPGEATGIFALEVAMDELAYALHMDPVEFRLKNFAGRDPSTDKPFSSNHLRECYSRGAERFGWHRRSSEPRSMRDGDFLMGWGMATATFPGYRLPSTALACVRSDGTALVASGSHDMGTGTYSTMTQVASHALGIDIAKIEVKLGDSSLPEAAVAGGSMTTASVCPAVHSASTEVKGKIVRMAISDARSPLFGAAQGGIEVRDGVLFLATAQDRRDSYTAILARNGEKAVEATNTVGPEKDIDNYSVHSFGAVFAEVLVDPDLCTPRMRRVTAVYDVGTLVNKKTGRNQLAGGIVMGIGAALLEDTQIDENNGRVVNANLADYHLPVNADIGEIDVSVLDIPDTKFNSLGVRGIGEIGITGVAGAVANAVYHATGKRVRNLPITPDKLLS